MVSKFARPADTPKSACGRCCWWKQTNEVGSGHCSIWDESRWYKCMVCDEYDMEPDDPGKEA
jgi:hypothetical protein